MVDETREKLVTYASDLSYADLTPEAIHAVKRSVVDSIGCAIGAFHAEPVMAARNLAAQVSAVRPATVIGHTDQKLARACGLRQQRHDPICRFQ